MGQPKTPHSEFRRVFWAAGGHGKVRGGDVGPVCGRVGSSRAAKATHRDGIAAGASFRA